MAALLAGDRVVACHHEEMKKGQAERLMPMLSEVLADAGVDWGALDAIGVGVGPGNFTGIRISVSAARGLAMSLGVPAVGVSAFEAMAFGAEGVAEVNALWQASDALRAGVDFAGLRAGAEQGGDEPRQNNSSHKVILKMIINLLVVFVIMINDFFLITLQVSYGEYLLKIMI